MSWTPPNHGDVRDKQNFDCDDPMRAGAIVSSLLLKHREIWVRKSASKRGYHVVVDSEPNLIERWILGDCRGRLWGDWKRKIVGLPVGVLFGYKNKKFASRWVRVRVINLDGGDS